MSHDEEYEYEYEDDDYQEDEYEPPRRGASRSRGSRSSGGRGGDKTGLLLTRIFAGCYSSFSVIACLLFFLPWVSLSCNNNALFTQTGLQVMTGEASVNEKFFEEMGQMGRGFPGGGGKAKGPSEKELQKMNDDIEGMGLLAVFPIGLILAAVTGFVLLAISKGKSLPIGPLIGLSLALLILIILVITGTPMEKSIAQQMAEKGQGRPGSPDAEMFKSMFQFGFEPSFILAFLLTGLGWGTALAHLIVTMVRSEGPRNRYR